MEALKYMLSALTIVSAGLGLSVGLSGCAPRPVASHGAPGECGQCHASDYQPAPIVASHLASVAEARCSDCHVDTEWLPALPGAHPDARFALDAPHDYSCLQCHDHSSQEPAALNTNCVGCHDGAHSELAAAGRHQDVAQYIFDPRSPSFCRACHPNGQEKIAHPEEKFPITTGVHRYTCFDCHSRQAGGLAMAESTDCVGCHAKAHGEAIAAQRHVRVSEYEFEPGNPDFCLKCHARGMQP